MNAPPPGVWAQCKVSGPAHGVAPSLLAALCWKESAYYPYAFNPEPRYRYLVDARTGMPFRTLTPAEIASEEPPSDFPALYGDPDQEWWLQQASIGIAQVMGAVAREHGVKGRSLLELVRIELNLEIAARHLSRQIKRFGSTEEGLSAYNAGAPTAKNRATYVMPILGVAATLNGGAL